MNNANIQKAGFIVLPYGTTLNRFLEDKSLEVFWDEIAVKQKLESETLMSDEKHLPEIVPIHITIPLNKIQINEPEPIHNRRLNARLQPVPEEFFNNVRVVAEAQQLAAVED